MNSIFKLTLVLALLFTTSWVYAQSTAINYTLKSETMTVSGVDIPITTTINRSGDKIKWKHKTKGKVSVTNFIVNNITGDWNNQTSKGLLTYQITMDDYQGQFILEGTDMGLKAIFHIKRDGEITQESTLKITNITYQ